VLETETGPFDSRQRRAAYGVANTTSVAVRVNANEGGTNRTYLETDLVSLSSLAEFVRSDYDCLPYELGDRWPELAVSLNGVELTAR